MYTKFQFLNLSSKDNLSPFKEVVYSTTQSVGMGCRGLDFHGVIIIQWNSQFWGALWQCLPFVYIAHGTGNLVLRLFVEGQTAWQLSQLQLLFLLHSKTVVSTIRKLHSQHAGKSW